ncbi:MAG: hypothetical protein KGH75_01395 [Rhodospirillales bacterium]|nr:hypothetical protein [Rhodospirillales bacterium]
MDKDIFDIISSIEDGNYDRAMEIVDSKPVDTHRQVLAGALNLLDLKLFELKRQLEAAKEIAAHHEHVEDTYSSSFIDKVCSSIKDSSSALGASYLYNAPWFRDLEFSLPVKIGFAQRLIAAVSEFNPTFASDLWVNVANGIPDAISAISFKDLNPEG